MKDRLLLKILTYWYAFRPQRPEPDNLTQPHQAKQSYSLERELLKDGITPYRLFCADVATDIAQSKGFVFKVGSRAFGLALLLVGSVAGAVGFNVWQSLNERADSLVKNAESQLATYSVKIENQIQAEFQTDRIRTTMEDVARQQSSEMLRVSVEPSIAKFDEGLRQSETASKTRLLVLEQELKEKNARVEKTLSKLEAELSVLTDRNRVTHLADRVVQEGSSEAYQELLVLANYDMLNGKPTRINLAANSEQVRIIEAYGPFIRRELPVSLNVALIDPTKKDEKELTAEQIFPYLKNSKPLNREKFARLLYAVVTINSFPHALEVAAALKTEENLHVMHELKACLHKICSAPIGTAPGKNVTLDWWEKNKEMLEKAYTASKAAEPKNN